MLGIESAFAFFGKKSKDKDKTLPAESEPAETALETESAELTLRDMLEDGLSRCELLMIEAEKNRGNPKGAKLLASVEQLLALMESAKAGDDPALAKLRRAYLSPAERASASEPLVFITREGVEVKVDLEKIRTFSIDFFEKNDLPEYVEYLKSHGPIRLSEEARQALAEAIELHKFEQLVLFPPESLQHTPEMIQELRGKLADQPLAGLSEKDQYTKSYIQDGCEKSQFPDSDYGREATKKRSGAYLLGISAGPIPAETKNMTFPQAEKYLQEKGLNGLTLPEYYILQRVEAEQHKDHSFDAYSSDSKKSNWTWLIDSRAPGGCVRASWSPGDRQVIVGWNDAESQYPNLGARPAIVVPLL
jgi:hypothetical protein